MTSLWRKFPSGNILVKNFYSKTQDGVIINNEWWGTTQVPLILTLNKSSLVVDPQQLSVTVTTNTPFVGTIGKGSITLASKQQSVRLGRLLTVGKSTRVISTKTPTISLGYTSNVGKNTLNISYKNENISVGTLAQLNKMVYNVGNKPLTLNVGFNSALYKSTMALNTKPETILASALSLMNKTSIPISNKQLVLDVMSEIPFFGNISKYTLNPTQPVLSVHLGFNTELLPSKAIGNALQLGIASGFDDTLLSSTLVLDGKKLRLINTKIIYPSEQIFTMTERSSYNIMKPRKTFYTLTDK